MEGERYVSMVELYFALMSGKFHLRFGRARLDASIIACKAPHTHQQRSDFLAMYCMGGEL